jgi:hypothetical protein
MSKTNRLFGTLGLVLEGTTFAIFIAYFVVARTEIGGVSLPLPKPFIHYILMPVFLAAILGFLGLFCDRKRLGSITTIILVLPLLVVMGILNGSF